MIAILSFGIPKNITESLISHNNAPSFRPIKMDDLAATSGNSDIDQPLSKHTNSDNVVSLLISLHNVVSFLISSD
jgi:hypothetical protein